MPETDERTAQARGGDVETWRPHVFTVRFVVRPGSRGAFDARLSSIFAAVRAKPDLLYYHWLRAEDDPSAVLVHEAWADRARFEEVEAHAPYRAAFRADIAPLVIRDPTTTVWRSREACWNGRILHDARDDA